MFRPLELFIGLRYTRAKRRNHFISFISLTSMLGIALGITALITVLSVMNGFQQELRGRILAMTAHATLNHWNGVIEDWRTVRDPVSYTHLLPLACCFRRWLGCLWCCRCAGRQPGCGNPSPARIRNSAC